MVAEGRAILGTAWNDALGGPGVVAVDLEDGSPIWQSTVSSSVVDVVVIEDRAIVSSGGSVHVLDTDKGAALWAQESRTLANGAPHSKDGNAIFVNDNGVLRALEVDSGRVLWEAEVDDDHSFAPVVIDQTVFLAGGTNRC